MLTTSPPLTARSVVLSVLLGASPDGLSARDLVAIGAEFAIAPATLRVALSRLVSAGDLENHGAVYALSARHRQRQVAQEAALLPMTTPHDGTWALHVVTGGGRDATARAALRAGMRERRMAELREGVWTRPANLPVTAPDDDAVVVLSARPADEAALVRRLWDLEAWVRTADALLEAAGSGSLADRFVANAAIVRHLRGDPCLPPELLPGRWPADDLRRTYEDFRAELDALRTPEEER